MADAREPFNGPLYGAFQLGLIAAIVPGTPKAIQYTTFCVLVWISHYLVTKTTTGNPAVDLGLGSAILTQLLNSISVVFLAHPDTLQDIYHLQAGTITSAPLKKRIKWALHLYVNPRGIGWAHESRCTPPRVSSSTPRRAFILRQLKRAVFSIILECVAYTMNASNPFLTYNSGGLTGAPFIWRALGVGAFAGAGYARINSMHCLLSALVVGMGYSAPDRWPNLFGSPLQAWSVTRFWRYTWHQMLRKPLRAFATVVTLGPPLFNQRCTPEARKLDSTARSDTFSKLIWLCTAFLMSGTIHIGGEVMLLGRSGYGAFTFFTLQPLAIAGETLAAALWRFATSPTQPKPQSHDPTAKGNSNGNGELDVSSSYGVGASAARCRAPVWMRGMGYVWVALWFAWSLAFMIDPMVPTGMFVDPRVDLRTVGWYW
ncbi:membrane bound O-acyl transferase family-domain-containing protein [Pholiota molesta]|nr:membrane bound O-acyl transferase family-domain-containing protein [Pholiota molesta]